MLKIEPRIDRRAHAGANEGDDPGVQPLPRFGVALFDQSRDSGWACLADGDPFRFPTPGDLASDCIWICGCDWDEYNLRWKRFHHLRRSDYLAKVPQIAEDLGVRSDGQGRFGAMAQRASSQISAVIHRSMVIAAQIYGWKSPTQQLRDETLIEDIRRHLVDQVAPPQVKPHMRIALASAFQTYSSVTNPPFQSVMIQLRFNRLEYARRILATRVPDSAWMSESCETGSGIQLSLEQALNPERPCLVNATVEFGGRDPAISNLCAFGSQPGKRSVLRTWISQPELAWLSQHAHIQITAAHFTSGSFSLPRKVLMPEILTSDPLWHLSLSAGLVAEAHWRALALDPYKPSVEGKKDISVWAVWLRAADRAMCFEAALRAHNAGLNVIGYGNGGISVSLQRDQIGEQLPYLLDFAMENDFAHPAFRSIFEEHGLIQADSETA